jgi:hypothetical protein
MRDSSDSIGHCEKNVGMNLCVIMTNYLDRPFWICRFLLFPLNFCLWGWIKSEVYVINIDTPHELLARVLIAATRIKKCEDQLRRTTRDLGTGVAKLTEVDVGFFEHLLRN